MILMFAKKSVLYNGLEFDYNKISKNAQQFTTNRSNIEEFTVNGVDSVKNEQVIEC